MKRSIIILSALVLATAPLLAGPDSAQKTSPTPQEQAADQYSAHSVLYESLGLLSAHSIYLTYVSIGTLADGFAANTYDKEFSTSMISQNLNLIDASVKQMNKLIQSGLIQGEDLAYIKELIEAYDILKDEATAFKNYVNSGNKKDLEKYSAKRELAWTKISALLGIK